MNTLMVLYTALTVFGIGVTVVDMFGALDHIGHGDDATGSDDATSGDDATGGADSGASETDAETGDEAGDHANDADANHPHAVDSPHGGSWVASGVDGSRVVAKTISTLRLGVYFSLGAGPTGIYGLLTGVSSTATIAWSAGAGLFVALLSRFLRTLVRKDLDSSIRSSEFIMDEAIVTVPVTPGALGKAIVRNYGKESELYVRAKDPTAVFPKGSRVRIIDFDDDCYWIEQA